MKNIIDKHFAIKSAQLSSNILTIHAVMPIRKFIRDKKIFLNTQMLMTLLKSEYEIVQVLEESKISNWPKQGFTREGTWRFKVKLIRKPKQPNNPTPKKNTGPNPSFRGRMSKIAKEIETRNND